MLIAFLYQVCTLANKGFHADRSDRDFFGGSQLRRLPSGGASAAAQPAGGERADPIAGGIARRKIIYTYKNASDAFSHRKDPAAARGKSASRGFIGTPSGSRSEKHTSE